MSGIEGFPETSRIKAYDYCNSTWRSIAAQQSGEVMVARGELLKTEIPLFVTGASGGTPLGSGLTTSGSVLDRVILNVPEVICSGTSYYGEVVNSGRVHGVFLGGKSGMAPWPDSTCIASGKGLYLRPGAQKELFVQGLDEIYLAATPSGYPVTFIAETIAC